MTYRKNTAPDVAWAPQAGSQQAFLACPIFETLFEGTRGPGKEMPDDTPVFTPRGWRNHGDLREGDWVSTPDGFKARVLRVFPHPSKQCYRLEFHDGASVEAGADHLWKFRAAGAWKVGTTLEIFALRQRGIPVAFPTSQPVERFAGAPPIDPYLYGLLLGDGHLGETISLASVDPEIRDYARNFGFVSDPHPLITLGLRKTLDRTGVYQAFRDLGQRHCRAWNKSVHDCFREGSVETRLATLQGLMDTDGWASKLGQVFFASCSEQLALDVQYLARSLGATASLSVYKVARDGKPQRDSWTVGIQTGGKFCPFRLARKAKRLRPIIREHVRRLISIEPSRVTDCSCILIDHPEHLYVVKDFIVTHNTDALIMDFAQHCGKGLGQDWRGVLFRRTFPELADVIAKTRKWFSIIFPQATFNEQKSTWTWPTGEQLMMRPFERPSHYWHYHGHAYPWVGWEELTNWATDEGYLKMFSCVRSTNPNVRLGVRSTANPYGVGHNWVKKRFQLPKRRFQPIFDGVNIDGSIAPPRVAIFGHISENRILLDQDPDYISRLRASARNAAEIAAWIDGSWDVTAGGMFDDIFDPNVHVLPWFPATMVPDGWRIDRAMDWGTSKPFSVGFFLESDGTPLILPNREPIGQTRGDIILYSEWYGCSDRPNEGLRMTEQEVAHGITDRAERLGLLSRLRRGPADSAIFQPKESDDGARRFQRAGVPWDRSTKGPGSRVEGWQAMRDRLQAQVRRDGRPGLAVTERCKGWAERVPYLPRDDYNQDDVDTEAEDHDGDMTRYRVHRIRKTGRSRSF